MSDFNWENDAEFTVVPHAISGSTGSGIGMFVLILMHLSC